MAMLRVLRGVKVTPSWLVETTWEALPFGVISGMRVIPRIVFGVPRSTCHHPGPQEPEVHQLQGSPSTTQAGDVPENVSLAVQVRPSATFVQPERGNVTSGTSEHSLTHPPATQVCPDEHDLSQTPQCTPLVETSVSQPLAGLPSQSPVPVEQTVGATSMGFELQELLPPGPVAIRETV